MEVLRQQIIQLLGEGQQNELASIFEVKNYPADFSFGPHKHQNLEINFVRKGTCSMQFSDQKITFRKNDCMVIYPNVDHYFTVSNKPASLVQLEFKMDVFPELVPNPEMEKGLVFLYNVLTNSQQFLKIVNNQQITNLIDQTVKELQACRDNYQTMIRLLYIQLFILISRHISETLKITNHVDNPILRKAIEYINSHFTENISVEDIALGCGVSARHIRNVFRQSANLSPIEYLTRLKVNKAKELMNNNCLTSKDIAYMAGFSNPEYFTRRFKEQSGFTPSEYRHMIAEKYKNIQ